MAKGGLGAAPARDLRHGLPERLRLETAELHAAVEAAIDLPGSVRTRSDYVTLLQRLHRIHACLEEQLAVGVWAGQWPDIGLDIAAHRRAHLVAADLGRLGAPAMTRAVPALRLTSFGQALGCLYVLEGSSLGGRIVAGVIRSAIGEVPTTFFDGAGRNHPAPWRAVCAALRRFEAYCASGDVLVGARETFLAFGGHLAAVAPLA